ncbi:MAG: hypothetical protein ACJAV6_000675 [Candidatus Paceibacteria bacterium]|jgi:hypothetical protein
MYIILLIIVFLVTITASFFISKMIDMKCLWMEKNKLSQTDKVISTYDEFKTFKNYVLFFIFILMPLVVVGIYSQEGVEEGNKTLVLYCLSFLILGLTIAIKSNKLKTI